MTTKDQLKQYYLLNLLSNINANYPAVKRTDLEENILKINQCLEEPIMKKAVGDWKIVWGPATHDSSYIRKYITTEIKRYATDNAIYIAQKTGTEEYFIGISGTNGISYNGWFEQDFPVENMINWPPSFLEVSNPSQTEAKISEAATNGLRNLWALRPKGEAIQKGQRLIDFLKTTMKGKASTIAIGGHSLGGCLTPVLATAIADSLSDADYAQLKIHAYPTAGPTPGNTAFMNHLQSCIHHYHAVYNSNDIVPLSWSFSGLEKLKENYNSWEFGGDNIRCNDPLIKNFLHWATHVGKEGHYSHLPTTQESHFTLTQWENNVITSMGKIKDETKIKEAIDAMASIFYIPKVREEFERIYPKVDYTNSCNFFRFMFQVLLQHIPAYSQPQSSKTTTPWEISLEERLLLQSYFIDSEDYPNQSEAQQEASKKWAMANAIKTLTQLAKLAADWLDENQVTITSQENDMGTADDMPNFLWTDLIEIINKASKEARKILQSSPLGGNPYLEMFATEEVDALEKQA